MSLAPFLLLLDRGGRDELTVLLLEHETIDGESVYRIVGRPAPDRSAPAQRPAASIPARR